MGNINKKPEYYKNNYNLCQYCRCFIHKDSNMKHCHKCNLCSNYDHCNICNKCKVNYYIIDDELQLAELEHSKKYNKCYPKKNINLKNINPLANDVIPFEKVNNKIRKDLNKKLWL